MFIPPPHILWLPFSTRVEKLPAPARIGVGLCRMLDTNFREGPFLGTWVNRGMKRAGVW